MNTRLLRLLFTGVILIIASFQNLYAQVLINEICPSNINIIQNSNGKYDDWIELYNAGGSSVNLSGYGLTDDITKPFRFTFPSYSLGASKRLLVFASDSNSSVLVNHWEMAVNALASWKYVIGSASLDTNWRNNSFNDASWSSGNGGIGFGDGDDGTTIAVSTSVMMRKTFTVPDTSQIIKAVFMMDYDDGFVAYLNGVEIARSNLGIAGTRPRWNDLAPGSHEAMMYQGGQPDSFYVDPVFLKSILKQGSNVLSVETHNQATNSSDMSSIPYLFFGMLNSGTTFSNPPAWFRAPSSDYFNAKFKLSRTGETVYLSNPGGTVVDQKTFPSMDADNSYGRKPDGSGSWCLFGTPTPETSNNSSTCYSGYASTPVFSVSPGFYSSTRTLTLSTSTPGGLIRYTTNGDIPTSSSALYSSAISISSTKTIRARVFASGYLPSATVTNTYFINENVHLPVFTITTDSLNLWDYNTGIYVMGPNAGSTSPYFGANFWQDWQKPASIEYYDKGKNRVMKFDAEIEIYGNYSRAKPQKSFEIKLSDKYGTGEVVYQFLPDKSYIDHFDDIILRNSGTDWNVVHFRDALMERIMKNTYSGYLSAEPVVVYLNGAFWGVYTIHENHDENWMDYNYGLKKSEIDYLKEDGSTITVKEGSDAGFWTMYNYATTQNSGTQAYYDYMNSVLDLQSYTDYFIAETYYNNGDWIGDWTNNIKMWRPNAPGSKWRYLLYDTDFGFGLQGSVNDNRLAIARNPAAFSHSSEMFDAMLGNPTFKRYFINRYADLINTNYLPSNVSAVLHQFQDSMAYDMPAHFAKWGSNMSTWQSNINDLMSFVNARPNIMRDNIKTGFSLAGKVTLTLQVSPAGAGRIEISTITPTSYPWSGVYFNGNPVTITAIPNPGYSFDHWRSNVVISSNNFNQSATYNFTANDVITCYFTGSPATPKLTVSEVNYNSSSANDAGDWIELHNYGSQALDISGWKFSDEADNHKFQFPTGTVIAAGGYLVLVEDTAKFRSQFPSVTNKMGPTGFNLSNGGELVRIFDYLDNLYLSFTYQDLAPWPTSPDGGGYTLELVSPTGDLNSGSNWFAGCLGGSPGRAYSPLLATPVSVTGNTTFCTGGNVQLTATYNSGYSYQWKRNGTNITGAVNSSYTATLAGTYTVSVSYLGCSSLSDPTVVTVVSQGPDPVTSSASRCGDGQITLSATSTDSIFWYDAPNGTLVGTGPVFITPVLSATTTYYSRSSTVCPSNAVAATATILTPAATPVSSDVTRCGPGSVTLTASDTAVIRWYNSLAGGAILETGTSYTTNILNNDTVFYVEAGSVCPSPRLEVHVYVNTTATPTVSDNFRCDNGVVNLTAVSAAPVSWYTTPYGGSSIGSGLSFNTPSLSNTDTFYAEANSGCPSVRARAIAIVEHTPAAPTGSGAADCNPGSFTLTATSTSQVYWYDAPTGGNLLYTGSVFTTPVLTSTTTYYAEAGDNCRSSRTAFQVTISGMPVPPASSDVSRCGPGTVSLTASSPDLIYWYSASTGGTLLGTGTSFTTPSIGSTTTYYVEAGAGSCRSSRTAVQAIVNTVPSPPVSSDQSRCGTGTLTLSATSPETIYWYSASTGGTLLGTGSSFTTPSINTTTTYYAETGNNCRSSRIAVQAIILNAPAAPSGSDVSRCGSGSVVLNVSGSGTITWYAASSGGSSLATGTSYSTPSLSSTTTYYAEANNGCPSSRTPIQAIINAIPAVPVAADVSRCGTGTVSLSASGSGNLYWYSASSGGTALFTGNPFTTPSISSTTTYYVETGSTCRSSRIPVQAVVNAIPASPTSSSVSRCGSGTVTLTASSPETIYWYDQSSGGSLLATGNSYTTPVLSATTTYYVETGNVCRSNRISVQAVISTAPAAPVASNSSRCGQGTLTLTATASGAISWYSASSGGIALATGTSYTTPSISSTTTYYAETNNGCVSASRTAVQAIINPVPAAPVSSDQSRCGTGTLTLTASSSEQIYWYSASSGGTLLTVGTSYTTPSISSTTTYYVETGNTCRSNRIPVQAIINSVPAAPSASNVSRCGSGVVTLTASSPETIYWYDQSSGGTLLTTGNSFTTPALSSTTSYYVETGNNCRSNRVAVQAIISSQPAAPTASSVSRCGPGSVNLSASGAGTLSWYSVSTNGISLGSGNTFSTPSISVTTTYYVEANNGCVSATRTPVQAVINAVPSVPVTSNVSRCGTGTVTLTASSPEQMYWYNAATAGTLLVVGATYTTPSISTTTTYYVETGNSCRSSRVAVQAIINNVPSAPSSLDVTRCGPGIVTLTASSPETIYWYDQSSGGSLLTTGTSYTTPVLSSTTTYYIEAGNTCRSTRVPVRAVLAVEPAAPTAADVSRCGTGTVQLTASSPEQIYWYSAASGGTLLFTGANFTTPSLSTTTSYYAEAGNNCRSLTRTQVQAIIITPPSVPSGSDASRCGPGTVTLNASSPEQIYWYDAATNGNLLSTGSTYTTPSISTTTIYYVETGNNCRSTRVPLSAIINTIPSAPVAPDVSRCGSGSVTLTATSASPVAWYSAASGGSPLATTASYTTPSLFSTTTYYVEAGSACISARIPVQAVIATPPPVPSVNDSSRCGPGVVTLAASSATRVNWYDAAVGGNLLDTGLIFHTPSISVNTTYYAEAGLGCNSSRVSVDAIITPLPAVPITQDVSRCSTGTVTLTATSPEQIYWYGVSNGGTALATGGTFTTPTITTTTTYYVETGNQCRSLRVAVLAIVTPPPAAPVATDVSRCGAGIVTLNATSTEQINWYNQSSGGTLLSVGSSYNTPSLSSTTTYYVSAGTPCLSNRVPVQAIITTPPAPPVVTDGERCGNGSVVLSATSSAQINWYDDASGGTLLGTGSTFNTPVLTGTTVYYADAGLGCNSARVPVTATINPLPPSPSVVSDTACGSGILTLSAASTEKIYWYDSAVGGNLLDTGAVFQTPNISNSTTYFVEAGDQCRSIRRSVQAVIIPVGQFLVIENGSSCGSGPVQLVASSNDSVSWYDMAVGGTLLGTGNVFITPFLSTSQTYYAIAGSRCPGTAVAVTATIHPVLFIDLGPDTIVIQSGQSVTLDPGPGYVDYQWSTGDSSQTIVVNSTGTFVVTVLDGNGCFASDVIYVNVSVDVHQINVIKSFRLYPNPVHEVMNLSWFSDRSQKATIEIFSIDGRLLMFRSARSHNGEFSESINLSAFVPDVYVIRITDENNAITTRFVIDR